MTGEPLRTARHAVIVSADPDAVVAETAERVAGVLRSAVAARGYATFALAGGRTPQALYRRLAAPPYDCQIPWESVRLFLGDERWVPADHEDSNQRMVRESLLRGLPVPPAFHPMSTEGMEPVQAAEAYQACLAREVPEVEAGLPRLDLILLGIGDDGHTASLFPETGILQEGQRSVAAVFVPKLGSWRLSITFPVLNAARHVLFLVVGADKAAVLARVLEAGPRSQWPASLVQPRDGVLEWHVDRQAATRLGDGSSVHT